MTTTIGRAIATVRGLGHMPEGARRGGVAVWLAVHALVMLTLHDNDGPGFRAVVVVPVVLAGWFFGLTVALAVALLGAAITLVALAASHGWAAALDPGQVPGALVLLLIAAVVGRLRDLGEVLRVQMEQRQAVQVMLRDIQRERDRLDGVSLAAREMAHRLNNSLSQAVCALDALAETARLSPAEQQLVDQALDGLTRAADDIRRFQGVSRVATRETPLGPALDLELSVRS